MAGRATVRPIPTVDISLREMRAGLAERDDYGGVGLANLPAPGVG